MADDKATIEAINSIAAMFPVIDKETITDIYLGCKKDLDQTIDQLIGMGLEVEVKKPAPTPVTPKVEEEITPPNVVAFEQASSQTESPAEKARLELLNQQLSMEYRRLADTQERNMVLEKQLKATKESIAVEQVKLAEERRRLEEQQTAFLADKKRLEDHLSVRLREMKEQMRKNEVQEEENRARADQERMEAEANRLAEKEVKRAFKAKAKAERKALKADTRAREEQLVQEMEQEYQLNLKEAEEEVARLRSSLARCDQELEQAHRDMAFGKAQSESQQQQASVTSLHSVVSWLAKAVEDLHSKDNITPANIKPELLESLRDTL